MLAGVLELGDDLCVTKDGEVVAREDPVLIHTLSFPPQPKGQRKATFQYSLSPAPGTGSGPIMEEASLLWYTIF